MKLIISQTCKNDVKITSSVAEYLIFTSVEYLIPHKHTLKILCIYKHVLRRYKIKRGWVCFSEHCVHDKRNKVLMQSQNNSAIGRAIFILRV